MIAGNPDSAPPQERLLPYLVVALIGIYPVAIVFGKAAVLESIDPLTLARSAAIWMALSFLAYGGLRVFTRDRTARVQYLGAILLPAGTYGVVINGFRLNGVSLVGTDPRTAAVYSALVVAVATVAVRPWKKARRDLVPVTLAALAFVGANASRGVLRWWNDPPPRWISTADALTYEAVANQKGSAPPGRDIYYIVLDAMGRQDTLRNLYGLDTGAFVADLRSLGFYVADEAHSNYAHTVLSFSSFLNLDYLDSVSAAVGPNYGSHAPLEYLIQHNAMMRMAKQAGYEMVAIGSDVSPTKRFDAADVCLCQQYGLSAFEQSVVAKTPLAAAPLDPLTYGAHRGKILSSLDELEAGRLSSRRQFVFAHILAPHPPFTFAPDGAFERPPRPFMFNDGSDFEGPRSEYVSGYHNQAAFVLQRVTRIVHAILSRPGPRPVIVIHGDHGPGSRLQQHDASQTDVSERMNILAAYYFPDGDVDLYPTITPVNASRALANRYLGTTLPKLPDNSYLSTMDHFYDFIRVFPTAAKSP